MNLKDLIEEVERLKETKRKNRGGTIFNYCRIKLRGIKQAVEAVDEMDKEYFEVYKDWQKLKRILDIK